MFLDIKLLIEIFFYKVLYTWSKYKLGKEGTFQFDVFSIPFPTK